ncbi:MAG: BatA domain-containing protein [Pirellulaceae bacterium]
MWQFTFYALTWGFLLTLLPLLIHLINLLRHRRVKWAAMDFLLQSYKKHRRWVWLKQLLLLLLRMLIVALIVAMLAQWTPKNRILEALGGATTHHYVLIDDSLSMSELTGDATCFDIALAEVRRVVRQSQADGSPHRLTLIRFSAAAGAARSAEQTPSSSVADVLAKPIDAKFDERLEKKMQTIGVSELACGPLEALELSQQLIADDDADTTRLYIISDFRQVSWGNPTVVRDTLNEIQSSKVPMEFVSCVRQGQPNLAITSLQPEPGPQAAGVPLFVRVEVTNYGNVAATNVQLKLTAQTVDDQTNTDPTVWMPDIEELPVEYIDEIAEGETISRRVQVYFPTTGRHVVHASLADDPIRLDNSRWEVIDFRSSERCLVIDGDPEQRNAFFMQTILQPGGRASTGVSPDVQPVSFLRNLSMEQLATYDAVYLMDVRELEESGVEKLMLYCDNGGGLAIFAGPQMDLERYNERLYLDGKGILPMPLRRQELLPPRLDDTPDINIEGSDHPVFRNLLRGRNPIIRMAHVDRYLQPRQGWNADAASGVEVIASYRNGDPFAVEKTIGNGRIVFFTTTFAPLWNDLARSPNILYALNLHAHVSTGRRKRADRHVGDAIEVQLDSAVYQAGIAFITPGEEDKQRFQLDREARKSDQASLISAVLGGKNGQSETGNSGVYDAIVKPIEGPPETRRYAVNIDPIESDLTTVNSRELLSSLSPVRVQWRYADEAGGEWLRGDLPPNLALMALLILLLIGEQALAFSASYHPTQGGGRTV